MSYYYKLLCNRKEREFLIPYQKFAEVPLKIIIQRRIDIAMSICQHVRLLQPALVTQFQIKLDK